MPTRPILALAALVLALAPLPGFAQCDSAEPPALILQIVDSEHPIRLQRAEAMQDDTGASIVAIALCPDSAAMLARLTGANVGATMVLAMADETMAGETLVSAVVQEPINAGTLRITGEFDADTARTLAARIAPEQADE